MRTVSFHKKEETTVCLYCKKNPVSVKRYTRPCDNCKKLIKVSGMVQANIGSRLPAAVLEDKDGNTIFVDKFGKKIDRHNYNLENDPHGWKTTGTLPTKKTVI